MLLDLCKNILHWIDKVNQEEKEDSRNNNVTHNTAWLNIHIANCTVAREASIQNVAEEHREIRSQYITWLTFPCGKLYWEPFKKVIRQIKKKTWGSRKWDYKEKQALMAFT